jgi:CHAT domain-containing protein
VAYEQARTLQPAEPEQALTWADLAIELARVRQEPGPGAASWRTRAQALRMLGRYAEAIDAHRAAAERARDAGDARLESEVRLGEIDSLGMLGRADEAFALARRLEADLRTAGADAEAAKALVNAGNLHLRRDQYAEALDCYERAQATLAGSGDEIAAARLQANTAYILIQLNRIDEGIALHDRAREVFARRDLPVLAAMVDVNIGTMRYQSGEHANALALLTRARYEFERRDLALETAKCDADIADVYRELNLTPEALECYQRAIELFERLGLPYERARAEMGRASVLMEVGRAEEAFRAIDVAADLFERQRNGLMRAQVRLMRAYMLRTVGRVEEATAEAKAAATALARRNAPASAASARFLLADIGLQAGDNQVRRLLSVIRTARQHARGWLVCRAERALGLHYTQRGDQKQAIAHFRAGVAALEEARTLIAAEDLHLAFLRDKLAVYEDLAGALLTRGRPGDIAEALDCVERAKSRLLLERIQTALSGRIATTAASPARERLAALRAELSRSYHNLYAAELGAPRRLTGGAMTPEGLAPLEQAYLRELRNVELTDPSFVATSPMLAEPETADRLRAALAPDEALVEYFAVGDALGAFVLTREALRARPDIARLSAIARLARRLRHQLQRGELESDYVQSHSVQLLAGIEAVLRELHRNLLTPLGELLTKERVVVIPHGILHGLPFHAFHDGSGYAIDRYEFLYAPSAAIWFAGIQRPPVEQPTNVDPERRIELLAMGIPEPEIAHVTEEIQCIARLFPNSCVYYGDAATADAFRAKAGQARRIHLATHALFRTDNPLFSGLRLADLYDLSLNCELATLSACRTGASRVGPGDELLGLTRGFLGAGTRAVAASLWPADDAATAALMVRFYTRLAHGESRAAALRSAQRETRAEYPHPYHWAAFILIGER